MNGAPPQVAPRRRAARLDPSVRKGEILAAAKRLFAARGVEEVTVADVAREAGVARTLVHHYFGGKPELELAVAEDMIARAVEVLRIDPAIPVSELATANIDAALDYFDGNRWALAMLVTGDGRSAALDALIDRVREVAIDRILINHLGTSEVPPRARLLLRGYGGLVRVALREWLVVGRADREEARALMVDGLFVLVGRAREIAARAG